MSVRRCSAFAAANLAVVGCTEPPPFDGRTGSGAIVATADSRLGRTIEPQVAVHGGASGAYPLLEGGDAFAARMLLARNERMAAGARGAHRPAAGRMDAPGGAERRRLRDGARR